jgi:NhaD family Na+/H+ antiporter
MPQACLLFFSLAFLSFPALASPTGLDLTNTYYGYLALIIFVLAYSLVVMEEKVQMRKSKPVLVAAALIWIIIGIAYHPDQQAEQVQAGLRHNFLEYAELFFFLLVAMTYINAMLERRVFDALRHWLVVNGFSYRSLFWLTGLLAFCISPIADNLTTALIMCAVIMAVGQGKPEFITLACINIVVAANAGGAFSPFGDITTLMVWQKGILPFGTFFKLFIPSLVNWLIPAFIMMFYIPKGLPSSIEGLESEIKFGGLIIVGLFLLTIATAVSLHNFLHLPPVFGMMTGLAYLKLFGFYIRRKHRGPLLSIETPPGSSEGQNTSDTHFDIFDRIAQAEWDTLFFFYGVILAVGGLGFIGYLELTSGFFYGELGHTTANILVGVLSALVDNIPVMFAVLTMQPDMNETQWLLVTLTAGVGGSLLSVGSAAGVALMGQARGYYTFFTHLRWTPVIALGYAGSIWMHLVLHG